jgi:hypothetical protein
MRPHSIAIVIASSAAADHIAADDGDPAGGTRVGAGTQPENPPLGHPAAGRAEDVARQRVFVVADTGTNEQHGVGPHPRLGGRHHDRAALTHGVEVAQQRLAVHVVDGGAEPAGKPQRGAGAGGVGAEAGDDGLTAGLKQPRRRRLRRRAVNERLVHVPPCPCPSPVLPLRSSPRPLVRRGAFLSGKPGPGAGRRANHRAKGSGLSGRI